MSFIAAMGERERARVLEEVRALLASHPQTAGRDEVELAHVTGLYAVERIG